MSEQKNLQKNIGAMPIPNNLFDKYQDRLEIYKKNKEKIQGFIKSNLEEKKDYGKTDSNAKKNTLMKSGSEKILDLMECKIKFYPDKVSWQMLGSKAGSVCYVGYIIDQQILGMIVHFLMTMGVESLKNEEQIVKLFAWGEGRGACEIDEKVYSDKYAKLAGQPLKGSHNRSLKMAEKRCAVDAVIRTFSLDFTQDDDYTKTGSLKDDKPRSQKRPKNDDMPAENRALFSAILTTLNFREGSKDLFTGQERIKYKNNAEKIKMKLEDLKNNYQMLNKIANERRTRIKEANND